MAGICETAGGVRVQAEAVLELAGLCTDQRLISIPLSPDQLIGSDNLYRFKPLDSYNICQGGRVRI